MKAQRGVTLIELVVVVAIIGILAAVVIPTYRQQVLRSNRSDAKTALLQIAQNLERCYTRTSTFVDCVVLPTEAPQGFYVVTGEIDPTTYVLTATPQDGQARDTVCANFTLSDANVRAVSGTGTADECWSR